VQGRVDIENLVVLHITVCRIVTIVDLAYLLIFIIEVVFSDDIVVTAFDGP
jgi:hypothetical protein